jgi:transcriptional regulator GlxA family with amidase domain
MTQDLGSRNDPAYPGQGSTPEAGQSWTPVDTFDYIAVLAGAPHRGDQVEDDTAAYLTGAAGSGVKLLGICTGSFILCRLGLMRSRSCCVDWRYHQDFVAEFPDARVVSDRHFVVDEDRITSAGGRSATHLAAYLVERWISHSAVGSAPGTWHLALGYSRT